MTAVNATAEALIASARRRAYLPSTDDGSAFPRDSDILAMLNEEIQGWLVPFILQAREGHFLTYADTALVAGQAQYTIPARAAGSDVAFVQILDGSGAPLVPGITQEDPEVVQARSYGTGTPALYTFIGNQIWVNPAPSSAGQTLRIWYPQRPNQVVASSSAAVITGLTQVGGNFQVSFVSAPGTFLSGIPYEGVHSQPGFEIVTLGTANAVAATYVQFPGTLPSGISVGDYLCLEDTAPVVTNVPADLLPLLCQWIAIKIVEYRGDKEKLGLAQGPFKSTMERAREFLEKRDRLAHRKIVPARNRRRFPPFTVR